jgi:hypothetical protein
MVRQYAVSTPPPNPVADRPCSHTKTTCNEMKKIAFLLLACAPLLCNAAGKSASATMQVSFTVTEACTVQSAGKQAQVECTANTPFQLQAHPAAAASASTYLATNISAEGEPTVVYF